MKHLLAGGDQVVRDNSPMASPPHGLRTHNCALPGMSQFAQLDEPGMKVLAHGVVGVVVKALVSQKVFTAGSTSRLRPRRPPNTAMCSYAIWYADSESGRTSQLYCGLVLDRGTVRTSTTSRTSTFVSNSANAATGRVECPMVKNGLAIFQHCI